MLLFVSRCSNSMRRERGLEEQGEFPIRISGEEQECWS